VQPASDTITVRIDSTLEFDPCLVNAGQLVHFSGCITGRDIVELLKLVVGNSHEGVGQATLFSPHVRDHLLLLRFKVLKYC
jgi:hypothetical protein